MNISNLRLSVAPSGKSPNLIMYSMIFLCMVLLLTIYPIANTIAARNILLVSGALLSLYLLYKNKNINSLIAYLPLLSLLLVVVWLIIHYLTIPTLVDKQLHELKSTWLRVLLAIIFGFGAGISVCRMKNLKVLYSFSIFMLPAAYILAFIADCIYLNGLPSQPYYGFFMTKTAATYFLMWPLLFYCGLFYGASNLQQKKISLVAILLTALCLFAVNSLNGLIVSSIAITFIFALTICFSKRIKSMRLKVAALLIVFIIPAALLYSYGRVDNKIYNIYTDTMVGLDIDSNAYWQVGDAPRLADGRRVNVSTFYRVASFKNGLRIIAEHPLGAGFTFLPYGYYMKSLYPNSTADHTHSGWVDFTLGVGIPGLLLTCFALFFTIAKALKMKKMVGPVNDWDYIWSRTVISSLAGIFLLWLILEISEKEYIEHTFFMISFFAASLVKLPATGVHSIS